MNKFLILLLVIAAFASCKSDDETKSAHLTVTMIDAPADYDRVLIDVQDVKISASEGDESWVSLDGVNKEQVDLLELVGGLDFVLADAEVPPGRLNQIRLVLGANNKLVIDKEEFDLGTPSAQTSGLKIQIHKDLEAGVAYKIELDFDAAKSIVKKGNGTYSLKPVIRTIIEAQSGSIIGKVTNAPGSVVTASDGTNEYSSYVLESEDADKNGKFVVAGVPAGTYTVTITPAEDSQLKTFTKESVQVTLGNATDLTDVTLEAE